jgi:hypothetical protein
MPQPSNVGFFMRTAGSEPNVPKVISLFRASNLDRSSYLKKYQD